MKIKQTAILTAVGAGAAIATDETGFLPGMEVPVVLASPGGAFTGSAILQTSEDNATWANAAGAVAVTRAGVAIQSITLKQFMRLNVTAFTTGSIQATALSNVG